MPAKSRRKGHDGEREAATLIADIVGGRAYAIGGDKDVASTALPDHHVEVKRRRRIAPIRWCEQAEGDAASYGMPHWFVLMREDAKPGAKARWYVMVDAVEWLRERAGR